MNENIGLSRLLGGMKVGSVLTFGLLQRDSVKVTASVLGASGRKYRTRTDRKRGVVEVTRER